MHLFSVGDEGREPFCEISNMYLWRTTISFASRQAPKSEFEAKKVRNFHGEWCLSVVYHPPTE